MGLPLNPVRGVANHRQATTVSDYTRLGTSDTLKDTGCAPRMNRMKTIRTIQPNDKVPPSRTPAKKITSLHDPSSAAISKNETGVVSAGMHYPPTNTATEPFFAEPFDVQQEARTMATEVIRHLLIWIADGKTLHERGLRASVALYCIRPDLVNGATLDQIGAQAGCTRQAVHILACAFRGVTGLSS